MPDNTNEQPPSASPPRGSVTVFGAGISGLTAAHELALREFDVTVVEAATAPGPKRKKKKSPKSDPLAIGGLAATQYDRDANAHTFPERSKYEPMQQPVGLTLIGEHGYRFFPSYYQHLFDTMQRTPVYKNGRKTRFSTYDNIVPCTTQATVSTRKHPLLAIPRDPLTGPLVGNLASVLSEAGYRPTDLMYLYERMIQFMASCTDRRKVYEQISSYDFFVGINEPGEKPSIAYSSETDRQLKYMPKVLVAFDGNYGDARTNIDNWVQMMLNAVEPLPKTDGILNGPTSEVWLKHWRRLLVTELRVQFRQGQLQTLTVDSDKVVATIDWPAIELGKGEPDPAEVAALQAERAAVARPDYCVVATDVLAAERVTRDLPQVGIPRQINNFTRTVPSSHPPGQAPQQSHHHDAHSQHGSHGDPHRHGHDPQGGHIGDTDHHIAKDSPLRDPQKSAGMQPWDRFQTLTGLQFFFDTEFDIIKGRVYFGSSEWGLSSVSQTPYWTTQPTVQKDGYATIVSVDVGNATTKSNVTGKTFMESSREEIAIEVWRQMTVDLGLHKSELPHVIPVPKYFTIDRSLEFGEHGVTLNRTPYLVPIVDDWNNRPGPEPWNPGHDSVPSRHLENGVWQAAHGGSWIHFNSLVFAGTYLKTFTRLTTMESANESARHAVNGILDHWLYNRSGDPRAEKGLQWLMPYGYGGDFSASPIRQPTPIGDYCLIQDMENHEIPALDPIRELDALYFAHGLPHPFVMAGIEANSSISSQIVRLLSPGANHGKPWEWPSPAMLLDKLRSYRQWLEGQLHGHHGHSHHWGPDGPHHHHPRHDPPHHSGHGTPAAPWPAGQGSGLPGLDQLMPIFSSLFTGMQRRPPDQRSPWG